MSDKLKSYYMMVGLPKTGKTQFAFRLIKYMREKGVSYHYHDSKSSFQQLELALKMGLNIIVDERNLSMEGRMDHLSLVPKGYEKTAIYMTIPKGKSKQWMIEVLELHPHTEVEKMIDNLELVSDNEGFNSVLIYDCVTGMPI